MPDWKDTVNLPRTSFPMKANLQATEPQVIARWERAACTPASARSRPAGRSSCCTTARRTPTATSTSATPSTRSSRTSSSSRRRWRASTRRTCPGWDCHGLPIELKVDRELGPKKREMSTADFRRACRAYAERFVAVQRDDFKRLGILGDWDQPYLTMSYDYQAAIVRALGRFVEQGWSTRARSRSTGACTAARRSPRPRSSTRRTPRRRSTSSSRSITRARPRAGRARPGAHRGRDVSTLIWTTTPWTIPSNLAIAFHPDFDYGFYDVDGRARVVAEGSRAPCRRPPAGRSARRWRRQGRRASSTSASATRSTTARRSACSPTTSRSSRARAPCTPRPATAPTTTTGVKYGLDIYAPVDPGRHFLDDVGLFAGLQVFDANPKVEAALAERGRLWHRETTTTSTRTAGGATTR
jgi:isoleucyl-tRNA synthetase